MGNKQYNYEALYFTVDGKKYKVYGKTIEEAKQKKQDKIDALEKGKAAFTKDKNILFNDYASKWLAVYNKRVSRTTLDDIKTRLEKYIIPAIGHFRIKDITRSDLVGVFNSMEGMSNDRIGKVRQTLKNVLDAAYDDGYILKVPNIKMVDMPNHKKDNTRRSITPYEREIALQVAQYHHAGAWVLTMLYCGLRPGETAALQGRHIDRKNMDITVEQALKHDGTIGKPKTGSGKRVIPLPIELTSLLPVVDPFDFIFKSERKMPLSKKSMAHLWKSFKREMNIAAGCKVCRNHLVPPYPIADDLVPYCFRHTFGCDCAASGIDIDMLSKLMGHSNISVTSKFYLHSTEERMKKAARLLEEYRNE